MIDSEAKYALSPMVKMKTIEAKTLKKINFLKSNLDKAIEIGTIVLTP